MKGTNEVCFDPIKPEKGQPSQYRTPGWVVLHGKLSNEVHKGDWLLLLL